MKRFSLFLLVSFILVFFRPNFFIPLNNESNSLSDLLNREIIPQYTLQEVNHQFSGITGQSSIQITGNNELVSYAEINNWKGNGSPNSPFITPSYLFNQTNGVAISIRNTDLSLIVSDCLIMGGEGGIDLNNVTNVVVKHNTIISSVYGLSLQDSSNCLLISNSIQSTLWSGIRLRSSFMNVLLFNEIISSRNGLFFENSKFNSIFFNTISTNNRNGIFILYSTSNHFKYNSLINNSQNKETQAQDDGKDNLFEYNHWNDWVSPDINKDGFVDMPYILKGSAGNTDDFPLTSPLDNLSIQTAPIIYSPDPDENTRSLSGMIEIKWLKPLNLLGYNNNYSIYISNVRDHLWNPLVENLSSTEYLWDTTAIMDGNFQLKVIATDNVGISTEFVFPKVITIKNNYNRLSEEQNNTPLQIDSLHFKSFRIALFIIIIMALLITIKRNN